MYIRFLTLFIVLISQVAAMQPTEFATQGLMRRFLGSLPKPHTFSPARWCTSSALPPFKGRFVNVQPDGFVHIQQERYPKFTGLQNVIQTFRRTGPAFDIGDLLCYPVDPIPTLLDPKEVKTKLDLARI